MQINSFFFKSLSRTCAMMKLQIAAMTTPWSHFTTLVLPIFVAAVGNLQVMWLYFFPGKAFHL